MSFFPLFNTTIHYSTDDGNTQESDPCKLKIHKFYMHSKVILISIDVSSDPDELEEGGEVSFHGVHLML